MKNISLAINAFLFAAIVVLYILFFVNRSGQQPSVPGSLQYDTTYSFMSGAGIVYINIDSVLQNYTMYYDILNDLQAKLKTSEAQLASREQSLRKEMEDYQYKIDRGLVTRAEAADLQQQLMQKEQSLYQLQNSLQMQLAEEEQVAQRRVLNSIMEYLKTMEQSGEYQFQFVLGTNTYGGNILYADANKDITKAVIIGLNEEYKKTQDKKKK